MNGFEENKLIASMVKILEDSETRDIEMKFEAKKEGKTYKITVRIEDMSV